MADTRLIPALPNDLALLCLVRLPSSCFPRLKLVNSLWRIALEGDRLYVERQRLFRPPSLFLVRSLHQQFHCLDLDLADLTSPRVLFSCDLQIARTLFPHPSACASFRKSVVAAGGCGTDVHVFNTLTRKWTVGGKMISSRSQFLHASLGGRLFVLGTNGGADGISSGAEVYDFVKDQWSPIKSPPSSSVYDICFAFQNKLFVRGRRSGVLSPSCVYSFDPMKNQWEEEHEMERRLNNVTEGSKVVATPDGTLLALMFEMNYGHHKLMLQRSGKLALWTHMLSIGNTDDSGLFLLNEGEKIVLLARTTSEELKCRQLPFFPRLTYIFVPCSELHLATFM